MRAPFVLVLVAAALVGCTRSDTSSSLGARPTAGFGGSPEPFGAQNCLSSDGAVCGRDGLGYSNPCEAESAGVAVAYPWRCGQPQPSHLADGAPCESRTEIRSYCFDAICVDGTWDVLPWSCPEIVLPPAATRPPMGGPTADASAGGAPPTLDAGASTGGAEPSPPPAPPPVDGGRRCSVEETVSFGIQGGSPPANEAVVLVPPATIARVSTSSTGEVCPLELPACDTSEPVDVADIATVLSGPALRAAFDAREELYGQDRRANGERVYSLTRFSDGETFFVGSPCGDAEACVSLPPGVDALPQLFEALAAQYETWAEARCVGSPVDGGGDGADAEAGPLQPRPFRIPVECTSGCTCPTSLTCDLACGSDSCSTMCEPGAQCMTECTAGECDADCLSAECDISCGASNECTAACWTSDCTMSCPSGGCVQYCEAGSTCDVDCSGGGCHVDCEEASTCNVRCMGGGCDVECQSGSTCVVDCPSGNCTLRCDLDATCP